MTTTDCGRVGKADQALAVPATPLRVDGPSRIRDAMISTLILSGRGLTDEDVDNLANAIMGTLHND